MRTCEEAGAWALGSVCAYSVRTFRIADSVVSCPPNPHGAAAADHRGIPNVPDIGVGVGGTPPLATGIGVHTVGFRQVGVQLVDQSNLGC